jgi:hypothetical protein
MLEEILLWLFVIFSGIAVGAGLYDIVVFHTKGLKLMYAETLAPEKVADMASSGWPSIASVRF